MAITFRSAATAANGAAPTSLLVTKPAGVVDDDVMVAFVVIGADQTIASAPSGWTLLDSQKTGTNTGDCLHAVYYKVASSEGANYTWTWSAGDDCAIVIVAYQNVAATPINVSGYRKMSSSSTTHTCPSVTPSSDDTETISAFGTNPSFNGDTTFTTPAGLTVLGEADPGAGTTNRAVVKVFGQDTSFSATGNQVTTLNNSAKGVGWTVTLSPFVAADLNLTVQPFRVVPQAVGCMLGWYDEKGYSGTNGLKDMEATLDTQFAMTRVYDQWWPDISSTTTQALNDGKLVLVSHKPEKVANAWITIANGGKDADITAMVNYYKGLAPKKLIFIFNHEPHTNGADAAAKSPTYGNMSDFVAAFRRIALAFKAANATNVKIGYCAVANFWACRGTPVGKGDHGYPGDDVVDVLCHDDYNFFTNLNPSNWDSLETVMTKSVALAKRLKKPLIWGELGCQYGANGEDRNTWWTDGAAYLKTGDAATYVLGFCYYHVDNHKNSGNYWRFAQGQYAPDGKTGFINHLSHDSYFLTSPIPASLQEANPPPGSPGPTLITTSGIASNLAFGRPSVSLDGGPITVFQAGAILSPADYNDPEESPGLDFGVPTITMGPSPPGPNPFIGPYEFQPPYIDDVPPILDGPYPWPTGPIEYRFFGHMKNRARGRTLILLKSGAVVGPLDWPAQVASQDNDTFTVFAEEGLGGQLYTNVARVFTGGHIYYITAAEAQLLDTAGFGAGITQKNWNEGGWNEGGYGG